MSLYDINATFTTYEAFVHKTYFPVQQIAWQAPYRQKAYRIPLRRVVCNRLMEVQKYATKVLFLPSLHDHTLSIPRRQRHLGASYLYGLTLIPDTALHPLWYEGWRYVCWYLSSTKLSNKRVKHNVQNYFRRDKSKLFTCFEFLRPFNQSLYHYIDMLS